VRKSEISEISELQQSQAISDTKHRGISRAFY